MAYLIGGVVVFVGVALVLAIQWGHLATDAHRAHLGRHAKGL